MKIEKRKIVVLCLALAAVIITFIEVTRITPPPPLPAPPTNQFIQRIETSISGISQLQESTADCDTFNRIINDIRYFHSNSDLGATLADNDYWLNNLTEKLLIEYSKKTIRWGNWTFSNSICDDAEIEKLSCCITNITKNANGIQSPFLDTIAEFQKTITLYNKIQHQNSICSSSLFLGEITSTSAEYPTKELQQNIEISENLINAVSSNKYLSKCTDLPNQLNNTIAHSVQYHFEFINKKIDYYYNSYQSNAGTLRKMYKSIEGQFEEFKKIKTANYDFSSKIAELEKKIEFL